MRKPFWKIVSRKDNQYAEMLLRCKPNEYRAAREKLEEYGNIQAATAALLEEFVSGGSSDTAEIIAEMQRQHAEQLDAIKAHLREHFSNMIAGGTLPAETGHSVDEYVNNLWESIEQ